MGVGHAHIAQLARQAVHFMDTGQRSDAHPVHRPAKRVAGAFTDVYNVMARWGANHGAISYGHIGAELITLAAMLRIPVCMHNVAQEKIFRPSAWNAFGDEPQGADYRACATYGPLYK